MSCLKCGRETPADAVFCEDCRLEMAKYPVRPGTVIQLPRRQESAAVKKAPRKRTIPLEDQVKILKKWVRILVVSLLVAVAVAAALAFPAIQHLQERRAKLGQNYSSIVVTTVPTEAEELESD